MKVKQTAYAILLMSLSLPVITSAQNTKPAPFREGDRVVFAGNSITEAAFYPLYIWQYYQLHFPERRITVLNAGVGGDVAGQIRDRFEDDVLRQKPTVVVLNFGMNDSRYFEYFNQPQEKVRKEAVATSLASFRQLEKKIKAQSGLRTIMMTSSPFDESRGGSNNKFTGKHQTMLEIAEFQEAAAKRNKWGFVDLLRPMTAINQREQKKDSMFTLTGPDRIHPGNAGHMAMAWLFLKAQGLDGEVVADVKLNANSGQLQRSRNAVVSAVRTGNQGISFDYLARSLPFPADSNARVWENPQKQYEVLQVIPFTSEMNQELLSVDGLKPEARYSLKIDNREIGVWTGAQWAKGINLAEQSRTPQYQQALQVADLNLQYREIEQKLRAYYWLQFNYFKKKNLMYRDDQVALDSAMNANDWGVASKRDNYKEARKKEVREQWQRSLQEIADRIYTINKPERHRIEIVEQP